MTETSPAESVACGPGTWPTKPRPRRAVLPILLGLSAVWMVSCGGDPRHTSERKEGLAIDPAQINLGTLKPGSRGEASALVVNRGTDPVTIDRFEVSCPCVEISPTAATIEPARGRALKIAFDPGEDPDFRGRLAVPLRGYSGSRVVVAATVFVEVSDFPDGLK